MNDQRVLRGDNGEVLPTLPSDSVHLIVTSPPYDDLRDYKGKPPWNFDALRAEFMRLLVKGGVVCWVTGDRIRDGSRQLIPERQALAFADDGWTMHDLIVWNKNESPMQRNGCHQQVYETIVVASKGKPRHVSVDMVACVKRGRRHSADAVYRAKEGHLREREKAGVTPATKRSGNVWTIPANNDTLPQYRQWFGELGDHPARFTAAIPARCIRTWSLEGDTVLDPFLGSGTTLAVARKLNRKGIGVEISAEYAALAERRVNEAVSLFDNGEPE